MLFKKIAAAFSSLFLLAALLGPAEYWARRKWPSQIPPIETAPQFDYFHLQIHEDFFKLDRWFGLIPHRYQAQRARSGAASFDAWKRPGVVRVFVIGGSVAMKFNDSEASRLGEYFRRALPSKEFEVVGCGMGGYDSYRDTLVEREVLRPRLH